MSEPTTTAAAAQTFPLPRTDPFAPPVEYGRLREREPLSKVTLFNGSTAWLITHHDDARRLLSDPRLSSVPSRPGFPLITEAETAQIGVNSFVYMDPPEHTEYRKLLISEFTVKRVKDMRPEIQRTTDQLIDRMVELGPPVDLVRHFSLALPSLVICELLGVPYRDREFFHTRTHSMVRGETAEESRQALMELMAYLNDLVATKRQDPADDLLSRLIARQDRENGASKLELEHTDVVNIATLLLGAGYETTANMLTSGALTLMNHPEQLALLREDSGLFRNAVHELLRFLSIADTATRGVAKADIDLDGRVIREGEGVIVANAAANRDPAAFANPEVFDVRNEAGHHLAFGHGPHQCLGQHMGVVELEIGLSTLFRRLEDLEPAVPVEELPTRDYISLCAVVELPVRWRNAIAADPARA